MCDVTTPEHFLRGEIKQTLTHVWKPVLLFLAQRTGFIKVIQVLHLRKTGRLKSV